MGLRNPKIAKAIEELIAQYGLTPVVAGLSDILIDMANDEVKRENRRNALFNVGYALQDSEGYIDA